jgi:hypothetical protein
MELLPKKKPIFLKFVYVALLFLAIFSGVMGLYGYLWNTLRTSVAKSIAKDFYLEPTQITCRANADCTTACGDGSVLGAGEACICLKDNCHYLKGSLHFSQAKFCDQDNDCLISCYEGPVSTLYYERANGLQNDCSGGCADTALTQSDGKPNIAICRNRQCQYRDGRTCYTGVIPGSSL